MSDYTKIELTATHSEKSTFDPALAVAKFPAAKAEPATAAYYPKVVANAGTGGDGTGTKIDLAHFSAVKRAVVKNLGTANVAAVYTPTNDADLSGLPAPAETSQTIPGGTVAGEGGILVLTDIDPAGDLELVAVSTDTACAVWIEGTTP